MIFRPPHFEIDRTSPLARDLVFAGLGSSPGGGRLIDSSPFANHGALTGLAASNWLKVPQLGRQGLIFDGTGYVAIPDAPTMDRQTAEYVEYSSFAAWVYWSAAVARLYIWREGTSSGVLNIELNWNDNKLYPGRHASWDFASTGTVANNTWTHVAVTVQNVGVQNNLWTAYIGGSPSGTGQTAQSANVDANPKTIGYTGSAGSYGRIADLMVWKKHVLSPAEIRCLADPHNVLLEIGGRPLILPPRRRFLPAAVAAAGTDYSESVADSVGLSDSASRAGGFGRSISNDLGISDIAARLAEYVRAEADSVEASDTAIGADAFLRLLDDSAGVTDAAECSHGFGRTVEDSLGIVDSIARSLDFARTTADSIGQSDLVSVARELARAIEDAVGVADAASRVLEAVRAVAETVGLADLALEIAAYVRSLPDGVGILDLAATGQIWAMLVADAMGIGDDVSSVATIQRTLAESLGVADSVTTVVSLARGIADAIGLADAAATEFTSGFLSAWYVVLRRNQ